MHYYYHVEEAHREIKRANELELGQRSRASGARRVRARELTIADLYRFLVMHVIQVGD